MNTPKVYDTTNLPDQLKQKHTELYQFNQMQFLGDNFLSAIFFSMIDYLFANNDVKYLREITTFRYINPTSLKISEILQRSCQMAPNAKMQYFQQELRKIDPSNTKCGFMLEELLKQRTPQNYDWKHQSNQKNVLQKINAFYYISITVVGQYKPSQGQTKVVLIPLDKGYFLAKFIAKKLCVFCLAENQKLFINQGCQHNICFNCLQKKFISSTTRIIDCVQWTCKKITRQEVEDYFQTNLTNNQIQMNVSQLQQTQLQNQMTQSNSANFNKNTNQMEIEIQPELKKCGYCKKESNLELFTNQICQHQMCFLCMQQYKKYCPIYNCRQYIDITKYEAYMEKFKKLECNNCSQTISNGQQYFTNICAHKFCTKCIKIWIFNQYHSKLCPAVRCKSYINKNSLDEYLKLEKLQYECCKCKESWVWDNLYSHSECEHLICFNCASKMISRNVYSCPERNCNKKYFCTEFEKYFEEQQLKLVNEDEKLIKQVKVEEERKIKEQQKQEESQKMQEEKLLQQGLENSYITDQIQKKSRFIANQQQQQQQQQQEQEQYLQEQLKQQQKQEQEEQQLQSQGILIQQVNFNQNQEKSSTNSLHNNQQNNSSLQSRAFGKSEKLKELETGECTLCFSPFSQYNLRQEIECKIHKIGVCCFLKVQRCPQCETKQFSSQIYKPKPKLVFESIGQQDDSLLLSSKQLNSPQLNYNDDSRINPRMTQTQSQIKQPLRNSTMDNNIFRSQIGYGQSAVKQTYPAGYNARR